MPEVSGLVTTTVFNTKIGEVENKIPDTNGLVTTTILTTKIGDQWLDDSGLVKKTDYTPEISDTE